MALHRYHLLGVGMTRIELLKTIWNTLYHPKIDVIETIEKFFHPAYEQCINGICMKRDEYIRHVYEQKKTMVIETIVYKHTLENEDELFALYYPKGKNTNNQLIEAEVIAYFNFKNQQLYRIHGQVRLLKGDLADVDMKNETT